MVGNLLSFNTELTGIIKQGEELKDLSLPRVFPGSWTCTGRRDAPWLRLRGFLLFLPARCVRNTSTAAGPSGERYFWALLCFLLAELPLAVGHKEAQSACLSASWCRRLPRLLAAVQGSGEVPPPAPLGLLGGPRRCPWDVDMVPTSSSASVLCTC